MLRIKYFRIQINADFPVLGYRCALTVNVITIIIFERN